MNATTKSKRFTTSTSVRNNTVKYGYGFTCECGKWHRDKVRSNTTFNCECGKEHSIVVADKVKQCPKCGNFHDIHNPPLCYGCAMGLK